MAADDSTAHLSIFINSALIHHANFESISHSCFSDTGSQGDMINVVFDLLFSLHRAATQAPFMSADLLLKAIKVYLNLY